MIEPKNDDEDMNIVVDEDELTDALATKTDVRLKSPERRKATKRSTARHDEEPSTKIITFEEVAMEEDYGVDVDSLVARKEDQLILYHAVYDLTEVFSKC